MSMSAPKPNVGKPLPLTDDALDRAAVIIPPDDVPAAVRHWEKFAPRIAKSLLNATPSGQPS